MKFHSYDFEQCLSLYSVTILASVPERLCALRRGVKRKSRIHLIDLWDRNTEEKHMIRSHATSSRMQTAAQHQDARRC